MKIHHDFERRSDRPLVLAIGYFDGMHRGHQEIVRAARRMRKPGWRTGVLTFANHPASFLRPGTEPPMLTTTEERIGLFAKAGIEECFLLTFDASISMLAPDEFLRRLVEDMGVRGISVGSTFRFGYKRAGDVPLMRTYCSHHDVIVSASETIEDAGTRISSTRIRTLVADGNIELADHLLGHAYELRGTVERGFGRGHDLGFPTANLRVAPKLLPKDGVYSAVARHDGRDYAALVSIGSNPQFDGTLRTIEAWMRDFHGTIYGEEVSLRDLRYVREQRVFASVGELLDQMRRDMETVAYPAYA